MGANELPVFLAVSQPSGPLIQCFITSASAASCASRSRPDICAAAPPESADSDLLQPGNPRITANPTATAIDMLFLIMAPSLLMNRYRWTTSCKNAHDEIAARHCGCTSSYALMPHDRTRCASCQCEKPKQS